MKILVPVSKVPDTTSKVAFTDGNTKFATDNVTYILNPTDEWYSLVRALEIVEKEGGSVTVIHQGEADSEQFIRKALAIGATDAVRIDAPATDGYNVALNIAEYAKDKGFDLVITGKETIDYNGSQMGGMIAEMLNVPYVSLASSLEVAGGKATVSRDIEGGKEIVEVSMPCVISAQKGMAEQRIPNMKGIMSARTKPLTVVPALTETLTSIKVYDLPPAKTAVKLIDPENMDELINLLHVEAKVI
ncbi:MAG: electron transfer flavoprotein subunit beta/FixA family protein [Bacteroidota bacterium]